MEDNQELTESEKLIVNCVKALKEISLTAEDFILQLNFVLARLGEMYKYND